MAEEHAQANTFDIRKIYVKDISVESPNVPDIFLKDFGTPDVNVDASIRATKLEQDNFYEVVLGMTITSKIGAETAFLVEVQQAGVFHIVGLAEGDLPLALEIACPNILLPFAREAVADLVGKAGFPPFLISPINFEGLYQQKLNQQSKQDSSAPLTSDS